MQSAAYTRYYQEELYPLQDSVLACVATVEAECYLTGGTALAREYLQHRYSDDLDFFWNDSPRFRADVSDMLNVLRTKFGEVDVVTTTPDFARMVIRHGALELKLDCVNDVPWHSGDIIAGAVFSRVDNPLNILSNKLCAISRGEAKDVVDIACIAQRWSYSWPDIVADAKRKDAWVNELAISEYLLGFPESRLQEIRWITPVDSLLMLDSIKRTARSLFAGADNIPGGGE